MNQSVGLCDWADTHLTLQCHHDYTTSKMGDKTKTTTCLRNLRSFRGSVTHFRSYWIKEVINLGNTVFQKCGLTSECSLAGIDMLLANRCVVSLITSKFKTPKMLRMKMFTPRHQKTVDDITLARYIFDGVYGNHSHKCNTAGCRLQFS